MMPSFSDLLFIITHILPQFKGTCSFLQMTYLSDSKFVTLFVTLKLKSGSQLPVNHFSAERTGFEPVSRFRRLHAFQACLLSHSSISPDKSLQI